MDFNLHHFSPKSYLVFSPASLASENPDPPWVSVGKPAPFWPQHSKLQLHVLPLMFVLCRPEFKNKILICRWPLLSVYSEFMHFKIPCDDSVSAWLGWSKFPRVLLLLCFWLGWVTGWGGFVSNMKYPWATNNFLTIFPEKIIKSLFFVFVFGEMDVVFPSWLTSPLW